MIKHTTLLLISTFILFILFIQPSLGKTQVTEVPQIVLFYQDILPRANRLTEDKPRTIPSSNKRFFPETMEIPKEEDEDAEESDTEMESGEEVVHMEDPPPKEEVITITLSTEVEKETEVTEEKDLSKEGKKTASKKTSPKEEKTKENKSPMRIDFENGTFATKVFQYERLFSQNSYKGDIKAGSEFRFVQGNSNSRILVTASHATSHMRNGERKPADIYTGATSLLLNEYTGVHVLHNTKESRDGNFYDDVDFKRELSRTIAAHNIQLVIDIHGAGAHHPFQVDIGTGNGRFASGTQVQRMKDAFHLHDITRVYDNHTFTAFGNLTVANYTHSQHGVSAMQVELHSSLRDPRNDMELYLRTVESLATFIQQSQ
ncbi:hypothetical protein J2S74_004687 [Evansella vedderi]|uniref:Stage II sporulation protein P n=1 Tax=Evansella vedderi TaxID=38282 RepID=A0ABU0A297_9BACI|nr:hypothetical protein [Evansella vedderi]MDQ0257229.1 hypothetical protein [Evansella vedderi]